MLLAEEDRAASEIHERRAERSREAPAFGAHEIDVCFAVDLRPPEKEVIDAPLPGEIEELARALGERITGALVKAGDTDRLALRTQKLACSAGDRGRRG